MESQEVDAALEDLESRLERLRSLYQQYFLGIEKLEPQIPRKDVDRRIWALRRAQIKNTRRRYKLNVIVQRYNTYQQYWGRILREIEAGTYTRHLIRAQKRFGDSPARTAAERRRRKRFYDDDEPDSSRSENAVRDAENDLAAMLDSGADPLEEAKRAVDAALRSPQAAPDSPETKPEAEPASAAAPVERAARPDVARAPLDDLDLDLDFGATAAAPTPNAGSAGPARAAARPAAPPARPATAGKPAPPAPAAPGRGKPALPKPRLPPTVAKKPEAALTPGPAAKPGVPRRPAPPPPRGKPPTRVPAPRQAPAPPAARPAAARPATGRSGADVSDADVKRVYNQLVEAKRSLNQSTRSVTVDGIAKSLRATLPKLQQKHRGKTVDFDVVIKNGKAVVKPVLK